MKERFEIKPLRDTEGIEIEFWETEFASDENTNIVLYDKYKIST